VKRFAWALAHATALLLLALGCQGIAGVEDVSFAGDADACSSYCSTLKEACPGDRAVYEDDETCSKVCQLFKAGSSDKPAGNTRACRADQADLALSLDFSENEPHCSAAGPGGGDICTADPMSPHCDGYCRVYMEACTSITKLWGFDTFDECTTQCAGLPRAGIYTAAAGHEGGDTVACRLYHATLAMEDPDINCEAAGVIPASDCQGSGEPSCDDYCRVNNIACKDEYKSYETPSQCKAVCDATRKGDLATDTGGSPDNDTIACRTYHSYRALQAPDPHCSHSGPAGDGVCSDDGAQHPNCTAFCRLFANGCPATFKSVYLNQDAQCVDECEMLEDANVVGGNHYSVPAALLGGNTLKCRTLHAVRALTNPTSADAPSYCRAAIGEAPCN
jgi:hypothetical protein